MSKKIYRYGYRVDKEVLVIRNNLTNEIRRHFPKKNIYQSVIARKLWRVLTDNKKIYRMVVKKIVKMIEEKT